MKAEHKIENGVDTDYSCGDDMEPITVGGISNYYGGIHLKRESAVGYWGILDYTGGIEWEEIPETLFRELVAFAKR